MGPRLWLPLSLPCFPLLLTQKCGVATAGNGARGRERSKSSLPGIVPVLALKLRETGMSGYLTNVNDCLNTHTQASSQGCRNRIETEETQILTQVMETLFKQP